MDGDRMKPIAVISARADDSEQKSILAGITQRCFDMGVDTFVYSNIFNHWVKDDVLNFENVIYDFFNPSLFGGVIVTAEAFFDKDVLSGILERIKISAVPAVVINGNAEDFVCVHSKDDEDFECITEHLIRVHGFTDIDILTGFKGDYYAEKRVAGCKAAFGKAGIPFRENKVHYGNFWTDSGEELARKYISKEIPLPQALVCTNDHMAFGVCDELISHGIKIPDQLAVTGYECTEGRIFHYPILTTYRRSRYELGVEAVNRIFGEATAGDRTTQLVLGNSCTCGADQQELSEEIRTARINQYHTVMSTVARFGSALTSCRSLAEYIGVLKDFMYLHHGASRLYLCIAKDWNKQEQSSDRYLCCDVHSDMPLEFNKRDLPPLYRGNKMHPVVYCFNPMVFERRCFGYSVLGFDSPRTNDFSFRDWSKTAVNALESLRMKSDIQYLRQCQSVSTLYDALTGFYREKDFMEIAMRCNERSRIVLVSVYFAERIFSLDENRKNEVISLIAAAIKKCCRRNEVCGRIGEDALAILYENSSDIFKDLPRVFVSQSVGKKSFGNSVVISYTTVASANAHLLGSLFRKSINTAVQEYERKIKKPHYKALSEIHHLIISSPKSAPAIGEASRTLNLGEGRFRTLYKECFGLSYVQDCINGRIARAKYLLCTSAMSIYSIALDCGYTDEKFFSRQFRRATACSPLQYRKKFML